VMWAAGDSSYHRRLRGLIVVLWRAGLRIHEALALNESDLDPRRGALVVRRGKRGGHREVGMHEWSWEHLLAWSELRLDLPIDPAVLHRGPTRGRPWSAPAVRGTCAAPPLRWRPTSLRAPLAAARARRGDSARGRAADRDSTSARHSNLGITSIDLHGIDNAEIIEAVHARHAPIVSVSALLQL
jgi:integrase